MAERYQVACCGGGEDDCRDFAYNDEGMEAGRALYNELVEKNPRMGLPWSRIVFVKYEMFRHGMEIMFIEEYDYEEEEEEQEPPSPLWSSGEEDDEEDDEDAEPSQDQQDRVHQLV